MTPVNIGQWPRGPLGANFCCKRPRKSLARRSKRGSSLRRGSFVAEARAAGKCRVAAPPPSATAWAPPGHGFRQVWACSAPVIVVCWTPKLRRHRSPRANALDHPIPQHKGKRSFPNLCSLSRKPGLFYIVWMNASESNAGLRSCEVPHGELCHPLTSRGGRGKRRGRRGGGEAARGRVAAEKKGPLLSSHCDLPFSSGPVYPPSPSSSLFFPAMIFPHRHPMPPLSPSPNSSEDRRAATPPLRSEREVHRADGGGGANVPGPGHDR